MLNEYLSIKLLIIDTEYIYVSTRTERLEWWHIILYIILLHSMLSTTLNIEHEKRHNGLEWEMVPVPPVVSILFPRHCNTIST
jgi:uncharacterized membrane protein YhaH (DUF805 family)